MFILVRPRGNSSISPRCRPPNRSSISSIYGQGQGRRLGFGFRDGNPGKEIHQQSASVKEMSVDQALRRRDRRDEIYDLSRCRVMGAKKSWYSYDICLISNIHIYSIWCIWFNIHVIHTMWICLAVEYEKHRNIHRSIITFPDKTGKVGGIPIINHGLQTDPYLFFEPCHCVDPPMLNTAPSSCLLLWFTMPGIPTSGLARLNSLEFVQGWEVQS